MRTTALLIALTLTVTAPHPQPLKVGDCVRTDFKVKKYDDTPKHDEAGRITAIFQSSSLSSLQFRIGDSDTLHMLKDLKRCRGCRKCRKPRKRKHRR